MAAKHISKGITLDVGTVKAVTGLTDIPDMGATPEKIDVTTLADDCRQYINGIKDFGDLEFTFIYESGADGNYAQLAALEGKGVQECVVTSLVKMELHSLSVEIYL